MTSTSGRTFYSPAYTSDTANNIVDTRSAIYRNPNIISTKEGLAKVSFLPPTTPVPSQFWSRVAI